MVEVIHLLEAGGGWYGGGSSSNGSVSGGGSGYIGSLIDGETTNGVNTEDGKAKITFIGTHYEPKNS